VRTLTRSIALGKTRDFFFDLLAKQVKCIVY
jgi:hypothetical protein